MTRDEYFNVYNRKKKGIALNTKDPRGMEMLYRLLEDADVFLTSYRPGALVKMGLNWEVLHEKFPKLIYAAITGFGDEGPEKDAPGFDTVAYWGAQRPDAGRDQPRQRCADTAGSLRRSHLRRCAGRGRRHGLV